MVLGGVSIRSEDLLGNLKGQIRHRRADRVFKVTIKWGEGPKNTHCFFENHREKTRKRQDHGEY